MVILKKCSNIERITPQFQSGKVTRIGAVVYYLQIVHSVCFTNNLPSHFVCLVQIFGTSHCI